MVVDNSLIWKSILAEIQLEVSPLTFNGWFKNTALKKIENNVAEIECANAVAASLIENRYFAFLQDKIQKRIGGQASLIFTVKKQEEKTAPQKGGLFETVPPSSNSVSRAAVLPSPVSPSSGTVSSGAVYSRRAGLRDDFIFESFAVSTTNEMAYAAAEAVAREPGKAYNPFFIYGGVGVGKTHLMQAVGRKILDDDHERHVKYATGEEFTNEIVDAIRGKSTNEFKKRYRSLDCLLLDDVQFIAGKEQIQEEFFHTFNAVLSGGGQVILTSDRPPEEMQKLEDRMRSRFQAGLIVDINQPNLELRCAILKIKSEKKGIFFPPETVMFLAESIKSAREIEGAILKVKTHLSKNPGDQLLPEDIKQILKIDGKEEIKKKANSWAEILSAVCDYFQIKQTALKGEKRMKEIVVPRQLLMYLLKTEADMTFSEIGNLLGGRDHTTIMHGVEKIEKLVRENEKLQKQIFEIKGKFNA